MPATLESLATTRTFARVLDPYLVIVPGIITARLHEVIKLAKPFFANPVLVWIIGAMMVLAGIFVIANHPYWRGASAILISLFGWCIGLRGLTLLLAPEMYERAAAASAGATPLVRAGFALLVLIGLWLTYDGWIARRAAER